MPHRDDVPHRDLAPCQSYTAWMVGRTTITLISDIASTLWACSMMLTLRLSAGSCRVSGMKQSTHLAICPAFGQTTSSPCGISLLLPPALMPRPFASVVRPPGTTTRCDPVIVIRSFWKGPDVVESPGSHDVARNLFRTQACDPGAG